MPPPLRIELSALRYLRPSKSLESPSISIHRRFHSQSRRRKPKVDLDRLLSPVEFFDHQRSSSGLAVLVPLFVFESSCSSVILYFLRFEWSFVLGALGKYLLPSVFGVVRIRRYSWSLVVDLICIGVNLFFLLLCFCSNCKNSVVEALMICSCCV